VRSPRTGWPTWPRVLMRFAVTSAQRLAVRPGEFFARLVEEPQGNLRPDVVTPGIQIWLVDAQLTLGKTLHDLAKAPVDVGDPPLVRTK